MAFGQFVVGGNFVVGIVVFLVLIAIQFIVINHGAVRISEVTARFTLDAMPGRQMAIDADLNAGLIDEREARERRERVRREADFYGAMDGAIRFTQRDALAAVLITGVNIVAGLIIGVLQHGIDLGDGGPDLHDPDGRRGPGDGDPGAARLDVGRPHHHARRVRIAPRRGSRRRSCWRARGRWPSPPACCMLPGADSRPAEAGVPHGRARCSALRRVGRTARPAPEAAGRGRRRRRRQRRRARRRRRRSAQRRSRLRARLARRREAGRHAADRACASIRKQIATETGVVVPPVHVADNLQLGPRDLRDSRQGRRGGARRAVRRPAAGHQPGHRDRAARRHRRRASRRSACRRGGFPATQRDARLGGRLHRRRPDDGALDAPVRDDPHVPARIS